MMGITVYRCQQIKENNCEQSTVLYVIAVQSLKPATLRDTLTASQWSGMWFFSLAFFAVIFMEMLSDFLLVTERRNTWKALNGNVSEAEFHNLQQIVLCENQKVSIEKKTCKYDTTGSDDMCNCCICVVYLFGIRFCYERDNYYTTYWNWTIKIRYGTR